MAKKHKKTDDGSHALDPKTVAPIREFIFWVTGSRSSIADVIAEIPPEKYPTLYLKAKKWRRDAESLAEEAFREFYVDQKFDIFSKAAEQAKLPAHKQTKVKE